MHAMDNSTRMRFDACTTLAGLRKQITARQGGQCHYFLADCNGYGVTSHGIGMLADIPGGELWMFPRDATGANSTKSEPKEAATAVPKN